MPTSTLTYRSDGIEDDLRIYHGFEIPKQVDPMTLRALRALKKHGVILVEHDDGQGLIARGELVEIAGEIGLGCWERHYSILLSVDDAIKVVELF